MRLIKAVFVTSVKVLAILSAALTVFTSISACTAEPPILGNGDRPLVVATIFPPYDFARNVAGEHADVELLVDVTDSHSYSPTAMDMVLIEESDVFIYTGGEGDLWAEDFLSTIDTTDKIIINMLEVAGFLLEESDETHHDHKHDHDHDHVHEHNDDHPHEDEPVYDEHVWLSPNNASSITKAISEALAKLDPDHAGVYQKSADDYCGALDSLDAELAALVESAERQTILVADRFPFRYLCEAYGLSYYAALPGCSSAADLTAVEYEELAEHLSEEKLPVVFMAEYSDGTIARTVLRESRSEDSTLLTLHSCHTLTKGQIDQGNNYLTLMRENINALKMALE